MRSTDFASVVSPNEDVMSALHREADLPRFGPGGLVDLAKKFYGLAKSVPLRPITGEAAAALLKGNEVQKAGDLAKQIQAMPQSGLRAGAVKALHQGAQNDLGVYGTPEAMTSKSGLGAALAQPRQLTRLPTRQDMLPPEKQQELGLGYMGYPEREDGEFTPDEEWVQDRAHDLLSDWFYNSGDTYDHKDVMTDAFSDLHDYLKGNGTAGRGDSPSWVENRYGDFMRTFLKNEGVEPVNASKYSVARVGAQPDTLNEIGRQENSRYRNLVNALFNSNYRDAVSAAKDLGYDTKSEEFRGLYRNAEGYDNIKQYVKNEGDHLDGADYSDTELFERHRDEHEESNREYFEERNYRDAIARAEEDAREGGHGQWEGGTEDTDAEGTFHPTTEAYRYGNVQRLVKQNNPDFYTQQNVFSFAPTGLTHQGGASGYSMDIDPAAIAKARDKLVAKGQGDDMYTRLLSKAMESPGSETLQSHFPEFTPEQDADRYLGHFRGSMLPHEGMTVPNSTPEDMVHQIPAGKPFLLEELQSDPAQTFSKMGLAKDVPPSLQDWVGQMGRAALHHAAESGATSFHVPTAKGIERLRGNLDYGWLYDKAIPDDFLSPIAKHYGVEVQQGVDPAIAHWAPDNGMTMGGAQNLLETRSIPMSEEMRQDILKNGVPYRHGGLAHFADGGDVPDPTNDLGSREFPHDMQDMEGISNFVRSIPRGWIAGIGGIPRDFTDLATSLGTARMSPSSYEHNLSSLIAPGHDTTREDVQGLYHNILPTSDDLRSNPYFLPALHSDTPEGHVGEASGEIPGSLGAGSGIFARGPALAARASSSLSRFLPGSGPGVSIARHVEVPLHAVSAHAAGGPIRMGSFRSAPSAATAMDSSPAHLMRHPPHIGKAPPVYPLRFSGGGAVNSEDLLKALDAYLEHNNAD